MKPQDKSRSEAIKDWLAGIALRHAVAREAREAQLPDPKPEEPACERHPDWEPVRRGPQPRALASECPFCLEEAHPGRSAEEVRSLERPIDPLTIPDPKETPKMSAAWDKRVEAERSYPRGSFGDQVVQRNRLQGDDAPSWVIEDAALERIEELREKALERDLGRRARTPAYVAGLYGPAEDRVYIYRDRKGWR